MYVPRERGESLGVGRPAPHLFLSHSSKDELIVSRLAEDLTICGVDVWLDTWELRVGDDLHERIAEAVHKSRFVAIAVGRHFDDSKWTKGELHQALSREKAEDRTVVLPLLLEELPLPPVITAKKFLLFDEEHYYPSLVHVAGLVHGLSAHALESAIRVVRPTSIAGCVEALRYAGYNAYMVVDTPTLLEVENAGGIRKGNVVRFNARKIIQDPSISSSVKRLLKRLSGEDVSE
jgi:hypothetical protein